MSGNPERPMRKRLSSEATLAVAPIWEQPMTVLMKKSSP
jgi:hypothetical protein